jgi:hypothetical protein
MVKREQFDLVENIQDCELQHQLVPKILKKYKQKLQLEELFKLYKHDNHSKMEKMRQFLTNNRIKVRKKFSFFGKKLAGEHYRSLSSKNKKFTSIHHTENNGMTKRSTSVAGSRKRTILNS